MNETKNPRVGLAVRIARADAFAKIDNDTLSGLLASEDKTGLTNILLRHVVPGQAVRLPEGNQSSPVGKSTGAGQCCSFSQLSYYPNNGPTIPSAFKKLIAQKEPI